MADDHGTLIEQATRGEPPAIESLLRRHLPRLRAFIRLRSSRDVRDRESSSDLAQSVCRELLENLDRFEYRGEPAFRAWLFAKALSKVQDRARYYHAQKRDAAREVAAIDAPAADGSAAGHFSAFYADFVTPSRVASDREQVALVERAFEELPDEYRELLTWQKIAGLSCAEIAARTERTESAIKSALHRAMKRLTWILSRETPHDA